jgi:NTE family protein
VAAVVFGPDPVAHGSGRGTALVLGAGGVLGAAWMTGVLACLADRLPCAAGDADLILGTSAGSVLAAALRCGASLEEMLAWQRGRATGIFTESAALAARDGPLPPLPRWWPGSLPLAAAGLLTPHRVPPWVAASAWLPHGSGQHAALRSLIGALHRRHQQQVGRTGPGMGRVAAPDGGPTGSREVRVAAPDGGPTGSREVRVAAPDGGPTGSREVRVAAPDGGPTRREAGWIAAPDGGRAARVTTDGLGRDWVAGRTWIAAVDYDSGQRVLFGQDGAPLAGLPEAVVASCSIPGWYEPTVIGGRRYVDGGVRSATSLGVLLGTDVADVYVLAPMASTEIDHPLQPHLRMERRLRQVLTHAVVRQARALAAEGKRVTVLTPGPRDLAAMGINLMDPRRREAVLELSLRTSADALGAGAARAA